MPYIGVSAARTLDAPAGTVYTCIADYREHHGRILPKVFSDLHVEEGGVGAGTVITFAMAFAGRSHTSRAYVSEPQPGHVLKERVVENNLETTFTVTPVDGGRTRVRIETHWESAGIRGMVERLLAPRYLRKVYAEELNLLERYARSQVGEALQPA